MSAQLTELALWPRRACREEPPAVFYAKDTHAARLICATCPIRLACLAHALERAEWEDYGVWGGTTPGQRRRLRRRTQLRRVA